MPHAQYKNSRNAPHHKQISNSKVDFLFLKGCMSVPGFFIAVGPETRAQYRTSHLGIEHLLAPYGGDLILLSHIELECRCYQELLGAPSCPDCSGGFEDDREASICGYM